MGLIKRLAGFSAAGSETAGSSAAGGAAFLAGSAGACSAAGAADVLGKTTLRNTFVLESIVVSEWVSGASGALVRSVSSKSSFCS